MFFLNLDGGFLVKKLIQMMEKMKNTPMVSFSFMGYDLMILG